MMKPNKIIFHGDGVKIKIAIITLDDPLYVPLVIEETVKKLPKQIEIKSITVLPAIPEKFSTFQFMLYQQRLMGTTQFCKILGNYLIRKMKNFLRINGINVTCKKYKITLVKVKSISSKNYLDFLKNDQIDVIVSIAAPKKFNKELIEIPKKACINIHAGKLPKYRGINPTFWSLLNKENTSAVTIHHITENFDEGTIINQEFFDLQNFTSLDQAYQKIVKITPKILIKTLQDIEKGIIKETKNDFKDGSYYSFPTIDDGKKFMKKGLRFI